MNEQVTSLDKDLELYIHTKLKQYKTKTIECCTIPNYKYIFLIPFFYFFRSCIKVTHRASAGEGEKEDQEKRSNKQKVRHVFPSLTHTNEQLFSFRCFYSFFATLLRSKAHQLSIIVYCPQDNKEHIK